LHLTALCAAEHVLIWLDAQARQNAVLRSVRMLWRNVWRRHFSEWNGYLAHLGLRG
jgi:hypothetical protein